MLIYCNFVFIFFLLFFVTGEYQNFNDEDFRYFKMTTTTTTNEILSRDDNDLTSPSNAIDQMISMSILDHADTNSDKSISDQNRVNCSPRFVSHVI